MNVQRVRKLNLVSGIVSVSGIIFELLLAANMCYLLGNAVLQYSLATGFFLSGMGLGSYLSRFVRDELIHTWFILNQLIIALVGGLSAFILFTLYAYTDWYQLAAYLVIILLGTCVGSELPMLVRMVTDLLSSVKDGTSGVLVWDYLGSLIGSIALPIIIVPYAGYVRGAFVIGFFNLAAATLILFLFKESILRINLVKSTALVIGLVLLWGIGFGDDLAFNMEQKLYRDRIIKTIETPYQRLTLTKGGEDYRLYINGNLQFSSADEYRYHEALIHIPAGFRGQIGQVLVLGGGDGLAVRELLKYPAIKKITLVDLDPEMIKLAKAEPTLKQLNQGSLESPKVHVVNQDAYRFLEENKSLYDFVIVDLPDPNDESLNKLYTLEFYSLVSQHLAQGGRVVTQATSPVFAREVYWTIERTVRAAGLSTMNYHVDVPSFGDWGFVLAAKEPLKTQDWKLKAKCKYLKPDMLGSLLAFGGDEGPTAKTQVNTLLKPVIVSMYTKAWQNY